MPLCPVNQRIPRLSNVAVLRFALPVEGGQPVAAKGRATGLDPDDRVEPAVGHPRGAVGPDDDAVRRGPVAERDLRRPCPSPGRAGRACPSPGPCTRPSRRAQARRRAGASPRAPGTPSPAARSPPSRPVVAASPTPAAGRARRRGSGCSRAGGRRAPRPRRASSPVVSVDDDAVRDEHVDRPRRRPRAEQPASVADLLPPRGVVLGGDRVQERRVHGRAAEREPGGLERAAEAARRAPCRSGCRADARRARSRARRRVPVRRGSAASSSRRRSTGS